MIYVAGSKGISTFDDGFEPVGRLIPVPELLYLETDPAGRFLYGVSGIDAGLAHVWQIDGAQLTSLGPGVSTGGAEPCHLVVDETGRHLLVANYGGATGGSVAVIPVTGDGFLGVAEVFARRTAPGPELDRQGESHIHQIVLAPQGEVLVVDLGADEVVGYRLVDGILTEPVVSRAPPGSGPRHLVLLPGGGVAVSGELGSCLLRARRRGRSFQQWETGPASAGPLRSGDRNYPSDLRLGADGEFVYLANRGADSIAVIAAASGTLIDEIGCGAWPRHLAPDGDRMFVSSTNANQVGVLDLRRRRIEQFLDVSAPMCVVVTKH